jgi:hypothetical protein
MKAAAISHQLIDGGGADAHKARVALRQELIRDTDNDLVA